MICYINLYLLNLKKVYKNLNKEYKNLNCIIIFR